MLVKYLKYNIWQLESSSHIFMQNIERNSSKQQIILCQTLAKRPKLTICSSRQPHSPGSMEIAFS